jgi:hypothetical protein
VFCKEWTLLCVHICALQACQLKEYKFVYAWLPWCSRDLHSKLDYAQLYLWRCKSFNLKCFCMEVQRKARLHVCVQVALLFICKCKILSAAASRVLYYSCCRWISELGAFWSASERARTTDTDGKSALSVHIHSLIFIPMLQKFCDAEVTLRSHIYTTRLSRIPTARHIILFEGL